MPNRLFQGIINQMREVLDRTIGVVDEDYYHSDNEGHIMVGLTVDKPLDIKAGQKIMQGIFLPYGITYGDMTKEKRNGGFGSTGK